MRKNVEYLNNSINQHGLVDIYKRLLYSTITEYTSFQVHVKHSPRPYDRPLKSQHALAGVAQWL